MRETKNGWEFEKIHARLSGMKLKELQSVPRANVQVQMNNQKQSIPAQNIISEQNNSFARQPVQYADINSSNY